jgi:hypothetical protein
MSIMKPIIYLIYIVALAAAATLAACSDEFLTSANASSSRTVDEPADHASLLGFAAAAYQPLLLDNFAPMRSSPASDGRPHSVILTAELRTNDVYRGGSSAGDVPELWRLFTFDSTPAFTLNGLWNVCYIGLARCNLFIQACANTTGVAPEQQKRFNAEAHFLRAWYTHLLWKNWGNVPYFAEALEEPFVAPQYEADDIYRFIIADLDVACDPDALPMRTDVDDMARASLAAALMLKARVVLYRNDTERFPDITAGMAAIIASGQYSLLTDFKEIWRDSGEFCDESIFEANHLPKGKEWNSFAGAYGGFGTLLPYMISPKADAGKLAEAGYPNYASKQIEEAWAFAPVRPEVYTSLYEAGDQRRDGSINFWKEKTYTPQFQNTGYFLAKYAPYAHDVSGALPINSPNNVRHFRYAETLLNYAELVTLHGQAELQGVTAADCYAQIRSRAFSGNPPAQSLNAAAIKLERHREFLGEGLRFWDLVRWGDAPGTLSEEIDMPSINYSRTFTEAKKYLPIPQSEIDKARGTVHELTQNEGWN